MTSPLTEEDVRIIAEAALGTGVSVSSYDIRSKSEESIGYMGNHLTLTIHASSGGKPLRRCFFVKTHDAKDEGDDFIEESGVFPKEVDLYRVVLGDMTACLGELSWCPKHYFSKKRVLVLEDLSEKGFKMMTEGKDLDRQHLEQALKALSSMHASSMLFEYRSSNSLISMYPKAMREILYEENKPEASSRKWITWQTNDLLVGIDLLEKYSSSEKLLIKQKFVDEVLQVYPLSKTSARYRNVLTHGDMWRNNLLFRYSEGVPVECRFVDFQFSRYAPPAHDVMHLLHYLTKKSERDREKVQYLQTYHSNLEKELKANGRDVRDELTWAEFLESCEEYRELALIQTLLSLHYILGSSTLSYKVESYEKYEECLSKHRHEYMRTFFEKESYRSKITETLHELVDNYIINK